MVFEVLVVFMVAYSYLVRTTRDRVVMGSIVHSVHSDVNGFLTCTLCVSVSVCISGTFGSRRRGVHVAMLHLLLPFENRIFNCLAGAEGQSYPCTLSRPIVHVPRSQGAS